MILTDDDLKRFHALAKLYAASGIDLLIHPDNVLLIVEELIEARQRILAGTI